MEGALEYGQELEFENFEFEDSEWSGEGEVFSEAELMELAGELLEINSEAELDQFLGKLIKKVGGGIKKFLPIAGTVAGGFFGGPLGAKIGKGVASNLSQKKRSRIIEQASNKKAKKLSA